MPGWDALRHLRISESEAKVRKMSLARLLDEAIEASDEAALGRMTPRIVVVGCGGGGCNSVHRMSRLNLTDAETIAINTDRYHLAGVSADHSILLGEHVTHGMGAGGNVQVGERCGRDDAEAISRAIGDADLVFVTAGMGGGTGTGIAPIVAETAREKRSLVVALVTSPFSFERDRIEVAHEGIARLNDSAHCTIILDNNKLLTLAPKLPVERAFAVMDHLIAETIKGLSETICEPSMINLDFSDFRNVMSQGGIGTMLFGESEDVPELVNEALSNPLLDVDFSDAVGALIHITGGKELSLRKAYQIFQGITDELPSARNVKFGARIRSDMSRKIQVMGIVTGVRPSFSLPSSDTFSGMSRSRVAAHA